MTKRRLVALFRANLIYANPQQTVQGRKKGKVGGSLTRYLLTQYIWMSLVFLIAYGAIFLAIDFSKYPGFFTSYVGIFLLITFAQSVTVIFNIFYKSKDLRDYLPLPFLKSEVFLAKFSIVALNIVPFLLPILALFIMTALKVNNIVVAIIVALITFVLFTVLTFTACLVIVSGITQTKTFQKHQNLWSTILMVGSMGGMIFGLLYLNNRSTAASSGQLVDQAILWPLYPFYNLLVRPFQLVNLLYVVGILALVALLFWIILKRIIPGFYEHAQLSSPVRRKKNKTPQSVQPIQKQLIKYNFSLIKDPALIMQYLGNSLIVPVCFIFPFLMNLGTDLSTLTPAYLSIVFVVGLAFSTLTVGPASLVGMIISLDRENYVFIKSLPFSLKRYLKIKFFSMTLLQLAIAMILLLAVAIWVRLPLLLLLSLLVGTFIGITSASLYYFYRDYRLLSLDWSDFSQLLSRGGGNFLVAFTYFGLFIVSAILVGITAFLSLTWPLIGNIGTIGLLVILYGVIVWHYYTKFWSQLS